MTAWLGVDIGGTNTRVGLVDEGGLIAARGFPTRPAAGVGPWAQRLRQEAAELRGPDPLGVGVACAGVLDARAGRVLRSPNLPSFNGQDLIGLVSEALGLPAVLENDANLYALGEQSFGAGQGHADLACLTLGTGVGGGLILDGRLVRGPLGSAGEIGHTLVVGDGRLCGCGARGCLEAYASATGLRGMLVEALDAGRQTSLGREDSVAAMDAAAWAGDALARELFAVAGMALGRAFADLVCTLGLDLIILGGGVARGWELMRPAAQEELARRLRIIDAGRLRVITGALGDDAPVLGAAALARDELAR